MTQEEITAAGKAFLDLALILRAAYNQAGKEISIEEAIQIAMRIQLGSMQGKENGDMNFNLEFPKWEQV